MNERAIFDEALEIGNPAVRSDFLNRACAGNAVLLKHIEGLLASKDKLGSFLVQPPAPLVATIDQPIREGPGTQIGPYKLLEQIGEGGMGVVYMAEQKKPFRRKVALKIIKPGMDTKEVIARFEAERQALALMDHPNIAKVLEAGSTQSGRPYFVMELVRGISITKFCNQQKLDTRQRMELFVTVCRAVQHAHQKGIIHRDLKPSNVLVELHDVIFVPKVIDFGVAKAINQQLTERTLHTNFAQMIGTPMYMSPEQAELSGLDVDTRTDVYSLGVLLYELLTGTTPFDKQTLKKAGNDEIRRIIREDEPPKPSDRISTLQAEVITTISQQHGSDPRKLSQTLRGELDWIVMKALEKDRARRYESASAFAADVERYLGDEPVEACPPSATYRVRKFARRNKTVLTTALVVSLALLIGTGISVWQAFAAINARKISEEKTIEAEADREKAVGAQKVAQQRQQEAETNLAFARDAVDSFFGQMATDWWIQTTTTAKSHVETMDKALRFFERFAQEPGTTPAARYERAMAIYRIGDLQYIMAKREEATESSQKAIAILENLAEAHPGEALYLHQLANGYWRLGYRLDHVDLEKGKEAYRQAFELFEKLEARFGAIWDESRHDSHMSGLSIYRECGCFGWYRYAQARMWVGPSRDQENAGLIREAEAGARKALALAEQVAEEFPRGYPRGAQLFHAHLGGFLKRQGLPGAEEHLGQAEALLRREPVATTYGHVSLARVLNDLGKPEEAVKHWERALWDPTKLDNWHTSKLLGFLMSCPEAQFEAFGPEAAVQLATKAVELHLSWSGNWRILRRIAHRAGGPERALSALQTAIELMPDDAAQRWPGHLQAAWMNLGHAHSETGDFEEAKGAFQKCFSLAKNKANAQNNVAWSLVTAPDPGLHDVPWAIELARKAVDLEPESGILWNTLGVARYRAGEWQEAIDALEKSQDLQDLHSYDFFFLAMAHWQLGHKQEAQRYFERAVEWMDVKGPRNEELLRFRAEAEELLGIGEGIPEETTQNEPERPPLESTERLPSQGRDAAAENSQGRDPLEPEGTGNAKP